MVTSVCCFCRPPALYECCGGEAALPAPKAKATASCPLPATGRSLLAVGYRHAHGAQREQLWGGTGAGWGAKAPQRDQLRGGGGRQGHDGEPRPHTRARGRPCTRGCVRVCGGSGATLHGGEGLCQSNTRHEPLW